eukprot:4084499-Pyramimonas_sp.AAC.2
MPGESVMPERHAAASAASASAAAFSSVELILTRDMCLPASDGQGRAAGVHQTVGGRRPRSSSY